MNISTVRLREIIEEEVIKEQTEKFNHLAETRGFDSIHPPELFLNLAIGLSKAWIRVRLPEIEQDYEVLCVEEERSLDLHDDDFHLILPVRLDAELRHKKLGTYHALEMKTTRSKQGYYFERFGYDIQTLMHSWVISYFHPNPHDCHSILMEFLYKGYENGKVFYSPFVRGFVKMGIPPYDETEYEVESKFARRKDWNPFNVWEEFNQDEWANKFRKILDSQILNMTVTRNTEAELEDFKDQIFAAHKRIQVGLKALEVCVDENQRNQLLNTYFPLAYHQFDHHLINFDMEEAIESGDYLIRVPHHPLEKQMLDEKLQ